MKALLAVYGFDAGSRVELLCLSENATYLVADGDRTAVMRVHRTGYHTVQEIASELAWTEALRDETGLSPPVVIPTAAEGSSLAIVRSSPLPDERFCVLFDYIDGAAPEDEKAIEWAERLGGIAATLHRHAASWQAPTWFERFAWDIENIIGPLARWGDWRSGMKAGSDEQNLLAEAERTIVRRLAEFGKGDQRYGLIHGDLRLGNLMVENGQVRPIDFDDCGRGWHLWDLATALTFIEHETDVDAFVERWVAGYRSVWQLDEGAEAEVPTFLLLRRLQLIAWLALHPETEFAAELGATYRDGVCELAEQYLSEMS